MRACHLLHDVYVLSKEETGWNQWVRGGQNILSKEEIECNRWVRRWGKMYYQRKGPGVTGGYKDREKYIIGGRDRVEP